MKTTIRVLLLTAVVLIPILRLDAAPATPSLSFEPTRVVASGFHSGRDIIIFGVGTAPGPYFSRMLRYIDTIAADSSGTVRYEVASGVPDRSVWFAIDAQTRDYTVGSPHETLLRPSLSAPAILSALDAGKDAITLDRRLMDILLVRPGSGLWIGSCGRNSLKDLNRGKSGHMQLSIAQFAEGPKTTGRSNIILSSDLIVVIDSETLEYFAGSPRKL